MPDGRGYRIPAVPHPGVFRCIKLWIPDDDFYLYAISGAYQFLSTWVAWEKDGTTRAKQAAQAWKDALAITYAHGWDCPFDPNDPGSIDDWIIDSEDVMINVNVDCCSCGGGGGGGTPTTIYCIDDTGNPVIPPYLPPDYNPQPTDGQDWPLDPETDPYPNPDDSDWAEFDERACSVANNFWYSAYILVSFTEDAIDTLIATTAIIVTLVALFPASFIGAVGAVTILEYARALVQLLISEQVSDILLEVETWLNDNREEIVCTVYEHRYNIPAARSQLLADAIDYVTQTVIIDPSEQAALSQFIDAIFPVNLLYQAFYQTGLELGVTEPIDCATCVSNFDWFVPAAPDDFETVQAYFTWSADRQQFSAQNCPSPDGSSWGIFYNPRNLAQHFTENILMSRAAVDNEGVPSTAEINVTQVSFDLYVGTSYAPKLLWLRVYDDVAGQTDYDLLPMGSLGAWVHLDLSVAGTLAGSQGNIPVVEIIGNWNNNGDTVPAPTNQCFIDNLQVKGTIS